VCCVQYTTRVFCYRAIMLSRDSDKLRYIVDTYHTPIETWHITPGPIAKYSHLYLYVLGISIVYHCDCTLFCIFATFNMRYQVMNIGPKRRKLPLYCMQYVFTISSAVLCAILLCVLFRWLIDWQVRV